MHVTLSKKIVGPKDSGDEHVTLIITLLVINLKTKVVGNETEKVQGSVSTEENNIHAKVRILLSCHITMNAKTPAKYHDRHG